MSAIIDESIHLSFSIIIGAVTSLITGNWWLVLVAIIGGSLIDLDHFIDYFIYTKFRRFNIKEFLKCEYFNDFKKLYIFFHGFEYSLAIILLSWYLPEYRAILLTLGLANLFHLIFDTIYNKLNYFTYFVSYRIKTRFVHQLR